MQNSGRKYNNATMLTQVTTNKKVAKYQAFN